MSPLLLMIAAANVVSLYYGPAPEETKTYKDWIVGCDNQRNCATIGLISAESESDPAVEHLRIVIEQPVARLSDPAVTITVPQRAAEESDQRLYLDGSVIATPPIAEDRVLIKGRKARSFLRKLAMGRVAAMRGNDGGDIAVASLAGLAAALLRIDDQQDRADTLGALYRRGSRKLPDTLPGYSVSVPQPARSQRPPYEPSAKALREWYSKDQCADYVAIPDPVPAVARLGDNSTLVVLPWRCNNGVYSLYATVMVSDDWGVWKPAEFDFDTGASGEGPGNVLVNPTWRNGVRVLESVSRLRATADCGRIDRFIWDGVKFRLSEQLVMPECRGSPERIRVWRVDVVP
jgi:hypothetical protein